MGQVRKPFQGVLNILRFNWHFYAILGALLLIGFISSFFIRNYLSAIVFFICIIAIMISLTSLIISYFVYDKSSLYKMAWLHDDLVPSGGRLVNIHSGFDETSEFLKSKYANASIHIFDFYDPLKHTEVSIRRARKAYPPNPDSISISTQPIPLEDKSVELVMLFLSAHEIRNHDARVTFFRDLQRVLSDSGVIVVTEHLRDLPNFLAYNIGFFHFHSKATWVRCFQEAGLHISDEVKITKFITSFTLQKDELTP